MKLHTTRVHVDHLRNIVALQRHEGVWLEYLGEHRSRSRTWRLDFRLYADPRPGRMRRRNMQHILQDPPDVVAATWHEWGYVIRDILELDPDAICGTYNGLEDFHDRTHGEFERHPFNVDHSIDCPRCRPFDTSVMRATLLATASA